MRKIVTLYHALIAFILGLYLAVCWLLMIGAGTGSFLDFSRRFSMGPLFFPLELLVVSTVLGLPGVFFCLCRVIQRTSSNPDRFRRWVSLPGLARVFSWQLILLIGLQLGFMTPWAAIRNTDWMEVISSIGKPPKAPEPPSDERLEYPTLPLALTPPDPYAWSVTDLEGNTIAMDTFRGRPLFLNFWATWCFYCKVELPNIQRLADAMKDQGVAVVLITEEEPDVVKKFMADNNYTFTCYLTKEGPPAPFEVRGIPATYILTPDGQVAFHHAGMVAWDGAKTQAFLKSLVPGAPAVSEPAPEVPAAEVPAAPAPEAAPAAEAPAAPTPEAAPAPAAVETPAATPEAVPAPATP